MTQPPRTALEEAERELCGLETGDRSESARSLGGVVVLIRHIESAPFRADDVWSRLVRLRLGPELYFPLPAGLAPWAIVFQEP